MSGLVKVTQMGENDPGVPVVIMVSSTAIGSGTTMLMTVYTAGTQATAGASFWVVPSGYNLEINAMQVAAVSSAILGAARLLVLLGTAAASLSVTSTVGVPACLPYAIQASTTPFDIMGLRAKVLSGTTVGVGSLGGSAHTISGAVIQGRLF
jgi:hypothetical protein